MNPEKSQPYASNTASRRKKGPAPLSLHNVQQISPRIISLTYFADSLLWWQNRHPYSDHMLTRILVSFLKTHQHAYTVTMVCTRCQSLWQRVWVGTKTHWLVMSTILLFNSDNKTIKLYLICILIWNEGFEDRQTIIKPPNNVLQKQHKLIKLSNKFMFAKMFRHPCVILRSEFCLKGRPMKFNITIQIRWIESQNLPLFPLHLHKGAGWVTGESWFDFGWGVGGPETSPFFKSPRLFPGTSCSNVHDVHNYHF
jgi:hypothetical protein